MQNNKNTLIENKCVLEVAQSVINGAFYGGNQMGQNDEEQKHDEIQMENLEGKRPSDKIKVSINEGGDTNREQKVPLLVQLAGLVQISYLAGTIDKEEQMRFKKMVYRATRGKALTYFQDLRDAELKDYTGVKDLSLRTVYVIVF